MNFEKQLGYYPAAAAPVSPDPQVIQYINLKLAALGQPTYPGGDQRLNEIAAPLLAQTREKDRLLTDYLCAADQRIHEFLVRYLGDCREGDEPLVPQRTFTLDRHGLARALSFPPDKDSFSSEILRSYRLKQGVLHNPDKDRRTTEGVFHVTEGGLPVPDDKKAVPRAVFARLLHHALHPPRDHLRLPFTSTQSMEAELFVSLLLRPTVCPEVPGHSPEKTSEVRFFAPGNMVCNLDFVESIFGNAGDPFLPGNDAGLDSEHWSGHTGCVILAAHLPRLKKKELGLPQWDDATERQQRDGMCWRTEDELYNDGSAFKVTCRDESGVMVTLIADNYFGYCKKEVKTQISFAANLMGMCEEEHAGGALAFPTYDLGEGFIMYPRMPRFSHKFADMVELFGEIMDLQAEGYGIDKKFPDILYVPEGARFDLHDLSVSWKNDGGEQRIKLLPTKTYVRPSGYKIRMHRPTPGQAWRLIGTVAEGTFCHKPSTVSGGGKSEISKPITDAILQGPVLIGDLQRDLDRVEEIVNRDYSDRFKPEFRTEKPGRRILDPDRSLGSVIKLLTPSEVEYTDEYNKWLHTVPSYIREIVFVLKRFYVAEWGERWRDYLQVDFINGEPGNELKVNGRKLVASYIRVGYEADGSWRVFGLRKDFSPSVKLQMEDDITASVVVRADRLSRLNNDYSNPSVKLVRNCEYRFFQRPDEAVHPGHDRQTELHFTQPYNFLSNYEPLTPADAQKMLEDPIAFDRFTLPMRKFIREAAVMTAPDYFACTANPRLVSGNPSKNPRFLQDRSDIVNPLSTYLAEMGTRFFRRVPLSEPVHLPVNAVLPGRRNNPPDPETGIRPLAVFNPVHYQELPELFIEFISSMTGKSPSTTGAGSEGALTKGPFNALPPIIDLNAAIVSYILTGYHCFTTAGGFIGPNCRIDHDISLLVPEVWCRMSVQERDPDYLIENGFLERVEDFEYEGKPVLASRLGYRITKHFVHYFFGRIFTTPDAIFAEEMLRPETQDLAVFVDGIDNMVGTARRVARMYFDDGSIEMACPPLRALLHIMVHGESDGKDINHPDIRSLFTLDHLLASDWYRARLASQREHDIATLDSRGAYLEKFLARTSHAKVAERLGIEARLSKVRGQLAALRGADPVKELSGTVGRHPL